MLSGSIWANIAQGNHLYSVVPQLKDNFYEENNPCNVVSTMLEQHCIWISSSQCYPNISEQHCTRKLLAQCLPRAHRILSQENRLFKICLAACFLTGYDITEQSWVFLFNARLGFIYGLRDNNEQVDSYMTSTIFSVP